MFRGNTSLPHIARNIGYEFAEKEGGVFHLCRGYEEGEGLERKIRRNLAGGPSIIFNRNLKKGDFIPNSHQKIGKIVTFDANALYPKCMQYKMPNDGCVHVYEPMVNEHHESWLQWQKNRERDREEELFEVNEAENIGHVMGDWTHKKLGRGSLNSSSSEKAWIEKCNAELQELWRMESDLYAFQQRRQEYLPLKECLIRTQADNAMSKPLRIGCGFSPDGIRYQCQFTDFEEKLYGPNVKGIVYEFLGDYFHCNPELVAKKKEKLMLCTKESDKKKIESEIEMLEERFAKTMNRFATIIKMGFYIKYEWESSFSKEISSSERSALRKIDYPPFTSGYMSRCFHYHTKQEYLQNISDLQKFSQLLLRDFDPVKLDKDEEQDIAFFGLAEVDISLPENQYDAHDDFPSLFVRGSIVEKGEKNVNLRGLFAAEKTVLTTPYLQYLLHIGNEITRVYRAWEYKGIHVLKAFVERVVEERKKGRI